MNHINNKISDIKFGNGMNINGLYSIKFDFIDIETFDE